MTKDYMFKWLKAALVRAVKTMAQTALGMLSGDLVGIMDVEWLAVLSVAALSGLASILTSVVGLPEVKLDEAE